METAACSDVNVVAGPVQWRRDPGDQDVVDGTVKGTGKGDDFGKAFIAILLGADATDPELKAGLLGGTRD